MATRKKTAPEAEPTPEVPTSSVAGEVDKKGEDKVRSSLEMRVLPSFDPRVKLLVGMMSQIGSKTDSAQSVDSARVDLVTEEVKKQIEGLRGDLTDLGLDVRVVQKSSEARPKTLDDRIADFLPVAARIIKGKHPDYIGWLTLDKDVLGKNMEKYIDFFFGVVGNKTPGTNLSSEIGALLTKAEAYFDNLINQQYPMEDGGVNAKVGLKNIAAFLDKAAK